MENQREIRSPKKYTSKPRLLEEPSLATTLQRVYLTFYIFLRLHVRPLLAIFMRNTQLFYEVTSLTTDPLFCVIRSYLLHMFGKY
jgi:hypothetical protein